MHVRPLDKPCDDDTHRYGLRSDGKYATVCNCGAYHWGWALASVPHEVVEAVA